jgi:trk system potassium uptake protein TrkH
MIEQQRAEASEIKYKRSISPLLTIFLSFVLVILIGTILLSLPFAVSESADSLDFIDALFISTSAVCVTGLTTISNLSITLSVFGKVVLALLIQIGGLGLVTIIAFFLLSTGKRIAFKTKKLMRDALNQSSFAQIKSIVRYIVITSIIFETLGTIMNMFVFINDYSFWSALGISAFHSISSFNNAGFDIIGSDSMSAYSSNLLLNFSTCLLVLCGGLGFMVIHEIIKKRRWKDFSIQSKIVLIMNTSILFISILSIKLLEGGAITWMQAVFYSVNLRTAGFSTFNLGESLSTGGTFLSLLLMFIGGSPLSTAGGIKTTTLFVLIMAFISYAKGKKTIVFKREITSQAKYKAFLLVVSALLGVFLGIFLILIFENGRFTMEDVIFECFSAFGTVGLSRGITSQLSSSSKLVICFLMYFGRIGPVSVLTIWNPMINNPHTNDVDYLSTDIMIG